MHGLSFLMAAVVANLVTNFALKSAVRSVDTTSLMTILGGLLRSPWAWCGLLSAGLLLASFMAAIRTLPLSTAYPILTALAIVIMTLIEWQYQGVHINLAKVAGIALTILGVSLVAANA